MRPWLILLVALPLTVTGFSSPSPTLAQTFSSAIWQLKQLPREGTPVVFNPPSSLYTIQFLSDGTVRIQADCNRASGLWSLDGGFDIVVTQSSIAGCAPGSFGGEFLDRLDDRTGFEPNGSELTLTGPIDEMILASKS